MRTGFGNLANRTPQKIPSELPILTGEAIGNGRCDFLRTFQKIMHLILFSYLIDIHECHIGLLPQLLIMKTHCCNCTLRREDSIAVVYSHTPSRVTTEAFLKLEKNFLNI